MLRKGLQLLAALSLSLAAASVSAQSFPARPIKVVSPFPAGGAADV